MSDEIEISEFFFGGITIPHTPVPAEYRLDSLHWGQPAHLRPLFYPHSVSSHTCRFQYPVWAVYEGLYMVNAQPAGMVPEEPMFLTKTFSVVVGLPVAVNMLEALVRREVRVRRDLDLYRPGTCTALY